MDLIVGMKSNQKPTVGASLLQHVLLVVLLLSVVLLVACKQGASAGNGGGGELTGVYALVSVDGVKVPANVSHEGTALQVRSGSFTVNADGTCSTKTAFVPPSGKEQTRDVSATYTRQGSKLTMKWHGAGITTATVNDGALHHEQRGNGVDANRTARRRSGTDPSFSPLPEARKFLDVELSDQKRFSGALDRCNNPSRRRVLRL